MKSYAIGTLCYEILLEHLLDFRFTLGERCVSCLLVRALTFPHTPDHSGSKHRTLNQ